MLKGKVLAKAVESHSVESSVKQKGTPMEDVKNETVHVRSYFWFVKISISEGRKEASPFWWQKECAKEQKSLSENESPALGGCFNHNSCKWSCWLGWLQNYMDYVGLGELFLFDGSDLRSFLGSFNSNCSIDFFSCLEHAMKMRTGTDVTCLFFSSSRLPELLDTALVHLSATTFRPSIPAALNDLELCFGSMGHADSPLLLCPVRAWDQHFLKQRMLLRTKCSNCFWRLAYISIY